MKKAVKVGSNRAKKMLHHTRKGWCNEKILAVLVVSLVLGLVGMSLLYNLVSKPIQLEKVTAARVDLQDFADVVSQIPDLRVSEIGQKDTVPKNVSKELVLAQADPQVFTQLPSAWATKLMTRGALELEDVDIGSAYSAYGRLNDDFVEATGSYFRLLSTLQETIEYNFISDFAVTTPLLPVFDRKIETNKETISSVLDRVNTLSFIDPKRTASIASELNAILAAYDKFLEDDDINGADDTIGNAQRGIVNQLADYWDEQKQELLDDIIETNSDLASIEAALK